MRPTLLCCVSFAVAAAAQSPVAPVLPLSIDPRSRTLLVAPRPVGPG